MNNQRTRKHGVKIEKSTAVREEIDEVESRVASDFSTAASFYHLPPLSLPPHSDSAFEAIYLVRTAIMICSASYI